MLVRRGLLLFPHPISHSELDHQIRDQVNVAAYRQALKSLCWRFPQALSPYCWAFLSAKLYLLIFSIVSCTSELISSFYCPSCKSCSLQRKLSRITEGEFLLFLCTSKQDFITDPPFSSSLCISKYLIVQIPLCCNKEMNT